MTKKGHYPSINNYIENDREQFFACDIFLYRIATYRLS